MVCVWFDNIKNSRCAEFLNIALGRFDHHRHHPEQIPTEYNEEQTLRAFRKQSQIPGERKDKTINDFPKAAAIGQILQEMDFPADKQTIVNFVERVNSQS